MHVWLYVSVFVCVCVLVHLQAYELDLTHTSMCIFVCMYIWASIKYGEAVRQPDEFFNIGTHQESLSCWMLHVEFFNSNFSVGALL